VISWILLAEWKSAQHKKMPRLTGTAFEVGYYFVCSSGPAEDVAKNASRSAARVAVGSVSIAGVLPVAIVIAAHESLAKSLRRGVLVVMRPLRIKVLPALRITGSGIQTSLVSLVHRNLGSIVIAAIVPVTIVPVTIAAVTIVAVVTVVIAPVIVGAIVVIDPAAVIAVIAIITVIVDLALSTFSAFPPPVAVSILVISLIAALALRIPIISIVSVLGLCCRAGHDEYTENKCKA
jgi:hypothetical protein